MENKGIGFIGCGAMGGALIRAMSKIVSPDTIIISAKEFRHAETLAQKIGCRAVKVNTDVAKNVKYLFVAVKPQHVIDILKEIKRACDSKTIIISMAAGVTIKELQNVTRNPVVRIMPNTPATVSEAMTALCFGSGIDEIDQTNIITLLESAGTVSQVPESMMNCVTAISGSGPAYAFIFIEALADAAVRLGMPRTQAQIFAAQTVKGASALALETGGSPAVLKDAVCSPGGTTIEAIAVLEKAGLRAAVIEAATAAFEKSFALSKP